MATSRTTSDLRQRDLRWGPSGLSFTASPAPQLSIHKTTEVQDWLTEHPRWQLVFTSKHASWLNQVEIFFSILTRRLLRHGQFSDPDDLATQMLAFVEHYNLTSQPFAWTYTGKVLAA